LPRRFFDRDARVVAPELLGKLLVDRSGDEVLSARLIEVEAYCGAEDPGSHAYRGQTRRNASMFARPGTLYVYFIYGMHWCMNAVCGPGEQPHAVLLRAAEPVRGIDTFRVRRPRVTRDRDLMSGPARLAQAFAIDGTRDGSDLIAGPLQIVDDGTPPPRATVTTRIGLGEGRGDELLLRFTAGPK
jgi:DNA-3-methyladenine glycosylase